MFPLEIWEMIIRRSDAITRFRIFQTYKLLWVKRHEIMQRMIDWLVKHIGVIPPIAKLIVYDKSIEYALETKEYILYSGGRHMIGGYGYDVHELLYEGLTSDINYRYLYGRVWWDATLIINSSNTSKKLTVIWKFIHHDEVFPEDQYKWLLYFT